MEASGIDIMQAQQLDEQEASRAAAEREQIAMQEQAALGRQVQFEETERKPTVGRILYFHTSAHDQQVYNAPKVLPAIVTFVNPDGSVNLTIFSDNHENTFAKNVMQGDQPGQWLWPY